MPERLPDGLTVNVLPELELEGDEDIWTQELKLLDETWNEPEQEVLEVLVVTDVLSIASENVTKMLPLSETLLALSIGEIDETVGAEISITNELIFNVTLLPEESVTVIVQLE